MKHNMIILATSISVFICMMDTTIMNIAVPTLETYFNTSFSDISWALNVYTIIFASLTIPLNRYGEIYGKNLFYFGGLILFLVGSVMCSLAESIYYLIVSRGVQSIGAAIVFPLSMVIALENRQQLSKKKVIAVLGITQGLAAAVGPTVGGILTEFIGWKAIFWINVPLVIIALAIVVKFLKINCHKNSKHKVDLLGGLLNAIQLATLITAILNGNTWGWNSFYIISLFGTSFVAFVLFLIVEKNISSPMMPLSLFKSRTFTGASIAMVLCNLYLVGVSVIAPSYLIKVYNMNELNAAYYLSLISLMIFIMSPISAFLLNKVQGSLIISLGFLLMTIAYVILGYNIFGYTKLNITVSFILIGLGYGMIIGPVTIMGAENFRKELLTASQSVLGVFRQIGITLAVAIFISVLTINTNEVKSKTIAYAENQLKYNKLPMSVKRIFIDKVKDSFSDKKVTGDRSNLINKYKKKVVNETYRKMLSKHPELSQSQKLVAHLKIEKDVNSQYQKIASTLNALKRKVSIYVNHQVEIAYSNTYKVFVPILLLSCFIGIILRRSTTKKVIK